MALTDTAIRALKPRENDYKVADETGLYLQVTPAGGRLWRFKFRAPGGAEKKLALGAQPCRSPAVKDKALCRMHGGKGSGAPDGNRNAWKHGARSAEARAVMAQIRELSRMLDGAEF